MTGPDPWADPATSTETGAPYGGPPASGAPGYGAPGYAAPGYGSGYGWAPGGSGYPGMAGYPGLPGPWVGPAGPTVPRRPGVVIAGAVLALVQGTVVAFVSAYLLLVASVFELAGSQAESELATDIGAEIRVVAWIQLAAVVALIGVAVWAINTRDRRAWYAVQGASLIQVALSLYWAVRVVGVIADIPGPDDGVAVFVFGAVVFAIQPAVSIGLLLAPSARRWFGIAAPQ